MPEETIEFEPIKVKVLSFKYPSSGDPEPKVIVFSEYTENGQDYVCGLNRNYISEKDKSQLISALGDIFSYNDSVARYSTARLMYPSIFESYRVYKKSKILEIISEVFIEV